MSTHLNLQKMSSSEKDTLIIELLEQNKLLREQCARLERLEAEIEALKDRLSKNSKNSSKPPSTDGYEKPEPKAQREESERETGGQPGHKGSTLEQTDTPDEIENHSLGQCSQCGLDLSEHEVQGYEARQVFELPEIKIVITEHRAEIKVCPCCDAQVKAKFPEEVKQPVQYGKRVQAAATYFSQYQLLPYKRTQEMFQDLFQLNLSQGTIKNILNRGYNHLAEFEQEIVNTLKNSDVVHFDESGVRVKKKLHWLHVASTDKLTYYHIDPKRGREAMDPIGILPEFKGHAVHDHWSSYYGYDCSHVLCNAHHLRELTFSLERHQQQWAGKLKKFLQDAKKEVDEAISLGEKSLSCKRVSYYEQRYSRILREGKSELPILAVDETKVRGKKKQHKAKNLHDRLVNHKKEVLAFVYDITLPFDNNLAERDIRMVKVKQKVSGCFRSEIGAQMFSRIRGYISTAKKQGFNAFNVLSDVFEGDIQVSSS
jgi:transposase